MNFFWAVKANGTILGPWLTIGPAIEAADHDGDSVVSHPLTDWTPQLAERP